MGATTKAKKPRAVTRVSSWGQIPPTLKVLYITGRERIGGWLAEAFAADTVADILLEQATGSAAGLARLRDELFDAVLVSHEPDELDALSLIEGFRAGGSEEPTVVLGTQSEQEMTVLCYEAGADGYVCVNTTTTRNLVWLVVRAVQRHQLMRENNRLNQAEQARLQREHDEANRLLEQQRAMLTDLEALGLDSITASGRAIVADEVEDGGAPRSSYSSGDRKWSDLPAELIAHYRELLRTYVIMGSGNLARDLSCLADLLVSAGLSAQQTMQLHLAVLEELIHGLGSRSTRHVMTRADLLALEIIVHLADGYRRRHFEYLFPPVQKMLPGFDLPAEEAF